MPPVLGRVVRTGDGHAQEQIYRRADHQGAEGTRGRAVGQRCVPEARHQRCDFGEMELSDARKLKALEEENRKFKKLLAETMLDASTLKEMLGKNF